MNEEKTHLFDDLSKLIKRLPKDIKKMTIDKITDCFVVTNTGGTVYLNFNELNDFLKTHNVREINFMRLFTLDSSYTGLFTNVVRINGDVKCIGDMSYMFSGCKKLVGLNGLWSTRKVTNMKRMFEAATSFNQPLNFNTKRVSNMSGMFAGAYSFNQPLKFDTKRVTDMSHMFFYSSSFNETLNFIDTRIVTSMNCMFEGANHFNQPLDFDTSSVTNMSDMFKLTTSFNQPLDFDTSSVTDMNGMFDFALSLDKKIVFRNFNRDNKLNKLLSKVLPSNILIQKYFRRRILEGYKYKLVDRDLIFTRLKKKLPNESSDSSSESSE
jgi:hypothetical protein